MKTLRLLALLTLVILGLPAHASASGKSILEDWERRLQRTSEAIVVGEYKKAERLASVLLEEMCDRIYGGENVGPVLAGTLTLKALAEAGLGKSNDALWDWWAATALDPKVAEKDLTAYGKAGDALGRIAAEDARNVPSQPRPGSLEASLSATPDPTVTPPKILRRQPPKYPRSVSRKCIEGSVTMETIIGRDGTIRQPRVLSEPPVPVMTLAILQALRHWTFRPARQNDQPVAVWYVLTTQFKTSFCLTP